MTPLEITGWTFLALVGVIGSALCSGLETATYCINRVRLHVRATRTPADYGARLLQQEIDEPERLLATNLIANAFFAYLGASGITAVLEGMGYSPTAMVLLNIAVLAPVFFIFVESLPKELFRADADRLTYVFAAAITVTRLVLTGLLVLPLVRLFADLMARMIGGEGEEGLTRTSRERIAGMLRESASEGVLSELQANLVDRALVFHRTTVADEMVPWSRVTPVPAEADHFRLMSILARTHFSRLPVVDARGRVVGVIRQTDPYVMPDATLDRLMVEPARVPPDMPVREALVRLRESNAGIGIVEQGGKPVGLVTAKDLLEPLTGELVHW